MQSIRLLVVDRGCPLAGLMVDAYRESWPSVEMIDSPEPGISWVVLEAVAKSGRWTVVIEPECLLSPLFGPEAFGRLDAIGYDAVVQPWFLAWPGWPWSSHPSGVPLLSARLGKRSWAARSNQFLAFRDEWLPRLKAHLEPIADVWHEIAISAAIATSTAMFAEIPGMQCWGPFPAPGEEEIFVRALGGFAWAWSARVWEADVSRIALEWLRIGRELRRLPGDPVDRFVQNPLRELAFSSGEVGQGGAGVDILEPFDDAFPG
jgi:hypothetical protein